MKRIVLFIGIVLLASTMSNKANAQFFKKLADKVSEQVEDKLINDAADASVKGVDKAERKSADAVKGDNKSKKKKNKEENQPENSSFSWPVQMNNTTIKKEKLPENYTLKFTGSGSDIYLKYVMQMNMEQSSGYSMDMSTEMYVSPDVGARAQTNMSVPIVGNMTMATLTNFKDPEHVILLNERKKTYSVMDLSEMEEDNNIKYAVTNLGQEKIFGLNCTHAKVKTDGEGDFDLWTTKEIPGFERMMALYFKTNKKMGGDQMWKALEEADAVGFLVKMLVNVEGGNTVMQLTEMKKITVPKSMLLVPDGYKKTKGKWNSMFMNR